MSDELRNALEKFDALDDKATITVWSLRKFPPIEAARLVASGEVIPKDQKMPAMAALTQAMDEAAAAAGVHWNPNMGPIVKRAREIEAGLYLPGDTDAES